MEEILTRIRVTNGLKQTFTDRFDGVPVTLAPGASEIFEPDMAAHIFGWHPAATPESIWRHIAKRQGWNRVEHLAVDESGRTLAERLVAQLTIEPVVYQLVEQPADPAAPLPADPDPLAAPDPPPASAPSSIQRRYDRLQQKIESTLR